MSRATRHTRTPAPPQTYSAPPGAATRPSSSPIHRRLANRAPAMMARGGPPWKPQRRHDPVGTSLDSRRVPLRAARGAPSLNTDAPARRRLDIADKTIPSASSTRARGSPPIATPLDLPEGRTREGEGARPCPGGAPGRPVRRGARVLGGPVPSTLFVIHEIPRATGCCASGRRTSVSHQLALANAASCGRDVARNSPHAHPRTAPDVFRASRRRDATFVVADTPAARESGAGDDGAGGSTLEATTSS